MSAEIINLNKYRKAKARAEKEQAAAENRIRHGRTKGERARDEADRARQGQQHDSRELASGSRGDEDDLDPGAVS
ncbi:MAG: DUF4169 family protein [Hyphomicrobium sp.]|nr:DUF4169 family protein [Hyphomicrobium sp.]